MFKAEKVLWGEGLFLRPQHFQIQDTYHEQHLNLLIRSTIPFSYGIQRIAFDTTQLNIHILALESIEVIWQDSEIYHAPAQDLLPEPLQLDELNLETQMQIYLAFPILQANKKNISHEKHYSLYPTVMIERLGIDVHFQKLHIGTEMLIFIKACFLDLLNKTGCRFIL